MKIIVCGYMIRHPMAGNMMAFLHYLLGLHRLGHSVVYLEESGWANSCYDPSVSRYSDDPSFGIDTLRQLMARFALDMPLAYVDRETGNVRGLDRSELERQLAAADVLLNIGGTCHLPELSLCKRRVLIDMDPMFTQSGQFASGELGSYQAFFSYGANIGRADCLVPRRDVDWLATLPPVVPEIWASADESVDESAPLTTICNWNAYDSVEYDGEVYGQKDEEFERLGDLPRRSNRALELAVAGADGEPEQLLRRAGWLIGDAVAVSRDFDSYARYIAGSRGEFSVAKNAYVKSRCGWFSDRSVCYLASGRPVILQDTGIDAWLPETNAVMTFSTGAQALHCIEELDTNYWQRCVEARALAHDVFGYKVVLPRLLELAFSECKIVTNRGNGSCPTS